MTDLAAENERLRTVLRRCRDTLAASVPAATSSFGKLEVFDDPELPAPVSYSDWRVSADRMRACIDMADEVLP